MRIAMIGVVVSTLAAIAAGPATQATTQPTTAPIRKDAPAATPKESLRSLNLALRDGDAAAIRSLFQTRDERGHNLVVAMADYAAALAGLHRSAVQAYGTEAADTVTGDLNAQSVEALLAIEKAIATVEGETATVKFTGATDPPVRLVKVDGRWKLPFAQLIEGADQAAEERRLSELTLQARLAQEMAAEVAAGKFKDANKAAEVWRTRLLEPGNTRSTTRPATQPARKG